MRKPYKIPVIDVTYPEFLCFRFRIIRFNGKILWGESFDIHKPFMIQWLKQATKKFFSGLYQQGRGVGQMVIKLPGIIGGSIIPENEEYEEDDEDELEEEIEIIRV